MISATEAQEAVHVLFIREVQDVKDARAVILKGGVTLRLPQESPRHSENMDLDSEADQRTATRNHRDELQPGLASHIEKDQLWKRRSG